MARKLKTFAIASITAVTFGAAVAATATPAQAFDGTYYGPGIGYAAGAVIGNVIAAGSYPYYGNPYAEAYGARPHGAPYEHPYPGYGYYYGY